DLHKKAVELLKAGKAEEALEQERQGMAKDAQDPLPHRGAACIYLAMGRTQEALSEAKKAVMLGPHDYKSVYDLGVVYQDLGNLQEALKQYKHATEIETNNIEAALGYAQCLFLLHHRKDAIQYLESLE